MTPALKPYLKASDTGVEWLGSVPTHWDVLPGRACLLEKKDPNVGLKETTVLSLSYGEIVVKPPEKLHGLVPASFETYQIVDPENVVVRPIDLQNDLHSLRFGISRNRGIITSAYLCFVPTDKMKPAYCHLLLHSYDLMKVFYGLGSGLRQNLDWKDFKQLPCLVPPLSEQIAITRFLDHMGRRIQKYIRAKEKLIALLDDYKQTLIHQAVTGQIDVRTGQPYGEYKESGVEWLGEVPEHWKVRRLCTLASISTGGKDTIDAREDGKYPFFVRSQTVERIRTWAFDGEAVLTAGDGAGVGRVFHYVSGRFDFHQRVYKFSDFRGILGSVFFHYIRTLFRFEVMQGTAKSTVDSLRLPRIRNFPIAVPPDTEQFALSEYIDETQAKIDRTASNIRNEVARLREYRTRLIADVVTGKLDVREAASALPEKPRSQCTAWDKVEGSDANQEEVTKMTNWETCPAVERKPGKVSGAWVFAGTRIPLSALYENLAGGATVDDFVDWFPGVDEQQVRTVLEHEAQTLRAELAR